MESVTGRIIATSAIDAKVAVESSAVCKRCAAGKGCGAGLLGASAAREIVFQFRQPPHSMLEIGDSVRVAMQPTRLLQASLIAYGLPLVGMLAVMSIGWLVDPTMNDWTAAACAALGLSSGWWLGRAVARRADCIRYFVPQLSGPECGN